MKKQMYLEQLLSSYQSYFDILKGVSLDGRDYAATATFHSRSEKYILVKKAQLWAMETNEYTYFSFADKLTLDEFSSLKDDVLANGFTKIKPHSEHMYSYISMVIIADEVPEDVLRAIKKAKYHKKFMMSLQGWMDLRIAVLDVGRGKLYSNAKGKDMLPLMQDVLDSVAVTL